MTAEPDTDDQAAYYAAEAWAKITEQSKFTLPASQRHLGGDLWALETVDSDGTMQFWLYDEATQRAHPGRHDRTDHEQLGPLSAEWRQRLGLMCGAETHTGKRCTRAVRPSVNSATNTDPAAGAL